MLLDYTSSPVGPYHELLYVGGFFEHSGHLFPSVTRILVDRAASREAGRENWGLPKELADFRWQDGFVRVEQGGVFLAEFGWEGLGPQLPAATCPLPTRWRTLAQPWAGEVLFTAPQATGRLRLARLSQALIHPALFPDVGFERPLLTLQLTRFELTFPPARRLAQQAGRR